MRLIFIIDNHTKKKVDVPLCSMIDDIPEGIDVTVIMDDKTIPYIRFAEYVSMRPIRILKVPRQKVLVTYNRRRLDGGLYPPIPFKGRGPHKGLVILSGIEFLSITVKKRAVLKLEIMTMQNDNMAFHRHRDPLHRFLDIYGKPDESHGIESKE